MSEDVKADERAVWEDPAYVFPGDVITSAYFNRDVVENLKWLKENMAGLDLEYDDTEIRGLIQVNLDKNVEQDGRLDLIEAIDPYDDTEVRDLINDNVLRMDQADLEEKVQNDRLDTLEANSGSGGSYDDTEVRGLISDNADKNDEQDNRLDALEAVSPGTDYDDTAIWESQQIQDERLDLLEYLGGEPPDDLWGVYKCLSSSSAPMAGQIRAWPSDDRVISIDWLFVHNETKNGAHLPMDQIDPGEHIRLTSPEGSWVDFTVADVEDRGDYQKITVNPLETLVSDATHLWSAYWAATSQVVFSLKQELQPGGSYDDTEVRGLIADNADKNDEQDGRLDALEALPPGSYDDTWLKGGEAGEVLTKASGTDKDVVWAAPPPSGGGNSGSRWAAVLERTKGTDATQEGIIQFTSSNSSGTIISGYDADGNVDWDFMQFLHDYRKRSIVYATSDFEWNLGLLTMLESGDYFSILQSRTGVTVARDLSTITLEHFAFGRWQPAEGMPVQIHFMG